MLGLVEVTRAVAQARDLAATLNTFAGMNGLGAYTNTEAAGVAGAVLAGTNVLCLVLAIGFAVPRLRTHRRAFWIPIVCALVAVLVSAAVAIGLVAADPAFTAHLHAG